MKEKILFLKDNEDILDEQSKIILNERISDIEKEEKQVTKYQSDKKAEEDIILQQLKEMI